MSVSYRSTELGICTQKGPDCMWQVFDRSRVTSDTQSISARHCVPVNLRCQLCMLLLSFVFDTSLCDDNA